MLRKLLHAKIHRAVVTEADPDYVGSLSVDEDLLDAAGIAANECILVADVTNGSRHWTYAIPARRGSGTIRVNGAATHLVKPGDRIIVMCFAYFDEGEAAGVRPRIVLVDDDNRMARYG